MIITYHYYHDIFKSSVMTTLLVMIKIHYNKNTSIVFYHGYHHITSIFVVITRIVIIM